MRPGASLGVLGCPGGITVSLSSGGVIHSDQGGESFLSYATVCSIFSSAGTVVLPMVDIAHTLSDVRILKFLSDVNTKTLFDVQGRPLCDEHCQNRRNVE